MNRIACLVLAAGLSRRMAPAHKLLEPFGGRSVLGATLAHLDSSAVDDILVVVGHQAERVGTIAASSCARASVLRVEGYATGLSASLAAGLAQVPADAAGVLVCLADMPLVRTGTVDRLVAAFRSLPGEQPIVAPFHGGRRGNPVLWHRAHFAALARTGGDEGGRSLLGRHTGDLVPVDTDDPGVLIDIDTPDALRRARASLSFVS